MSKTYTFKNFTDLTERESNEVLEGRNDAEVRRWMSSDQIITLEEHHQFIDSLRASSSQVYFRVERNAKFVGVYSLREMTAVSGVGGFWISECARRKMLGLSVVFHSIEFVFRNMSIQSIRGYQMIHNTPAAKLNRMLGFEETARPEGESSRMTHLILTREKWNITSTEDANLNKLVQLSEREV